MKITQITDAIHQITRSVLFENECDSNMQFVYSFSDADGVRTGRSGWSFGETQLDVANSPYGMLALRDIGFSTEEQQMLKCQDAGLDMHIMNAKLAGNKPMVDKWDDIQLNDCLNWSITLLAVLDTDFIDLAAFMMVPDYHNQMNFSRGGRLYSFLKTHPQPISAAMIADFKYTTDYGKAQLAKHDTTKDDVLRRYRNVVKLCAAQ